MSHCWANAQKWHSCILQSCIWYKTVDFECIPFQDDENRLKDSHYQWKTVKSMILLYYLLLETLVRIEALFFLFNETSYCCSTQCESIRRSLKKFISEDDANILFNRTFPLIRLWECMCVDCWNFQGFLNAFLRIQVFFEKIDEQRSGRKDPTIIRLEHQQIVTIELFRSLSFFRCVLPLSVFLTVRIAALFLNLISILQKMGNNGTNMRTKE